MLKKSIANVTNDDWAKSSKSAQNLRWRRAAVWRSRHCRLRPVGASSALRATAIYIDDRLTNALLTLAVSRRSFHRCIQLETPYRTTVALLKISVPPWERGPPKFVFEKKSVTFFLRWKFPINLRFDIRCCPLLSQKISEKKIQRSFNKIKCKNSVSSKKFGKLTTIVILEPQHQQHPVFKKCVAKLQQKYRESKYRS